MSQEQWEEYAHSMGQRDTAAAAAYGYSPHHHHGAFAPPPYGAPGPAPPALHYDQSQLFEGAPMFAGATQGYPYAGQIFAAQQYIPGMAGGGGGGQDSPGLGDVSIAGGEAAELGGGGGGGGWMADRSGRQMFPVALISSPGPYSRSTSAAASPGGAPQRMLLPGYVSSGRGGGGGGGSFVDARGFSRGGSSWGGGSPMDRGKGRGGRSGPGSSFGIGSMDLASEQNRGPRTLRARAARASGSASTGAAAAAGPAANDDNSASGDRAGGGDAVAAAEREVQYNQPGFPVAYDAARFFVIKSYSEDDVHKSIKYGVWASTPNGNCRLDDAYREAQATSGGCPVFLFFSVNASGQFCGVAEMTGPVDFGRSVDYWQQDKWSGRFPVTWHLVKDVPNHALRHITLENNEGKPVTNSRDTQEVRLALGLEMLTIFKNYAARASILEDFSFYDSRQAAMQEKRSALAAAAAEQQQQQQQAGGGGRLQPRRLEQTLQPPQPSPPPSTLSLPNPSVEADRDAAAPAGGAVGSGGQEDSKSDVAPEAASTFSTAELRAALPETSDSVTTPEPTTAETVPPGLDLAGATSDDVAVVAVAAESSDAGAPPGRQARAGEAAANDQQ